MSNNILNSVSAKTQEPTWLGTELCNASLKKLTTWHIGGPAERLYYPTSLSDLSIYLKSLSLSNTNINSNISNISESNIPEKPFKITWLGLGSNVLISDEGMDGLVIVTRDLNKLELIAPNCIYAQAGVTCAKLARFCALHNLQGGEFFAGIPGTIGGALAMNAGAFGGETWEAVTQLETMNTQGEIITRTPSEFDISYRTVKSKFITEHNQPPEGFVSGVFKFLPNTSLNNTSKTKIKNLLQERNAKQPIGTRNCGSVFRNPPGDHAARLIEACDLKGFQFKGAIISTKHANFIINEKDASSSDIEKIIQLIQKTVFDRFSILLIPEVKMLGNFSELSKLSKKTKKTESLSSQLSDPSSDQLLGEHKDEQ